MYNNVSTHDYEKYEYFVMDYHRKNHNQLTWHWRNIPEIELEKAGWITDYNLVRLARLDRKKNNKITNLTREYGLDGLSLDSEGNYHGIQAKYWKSRNLTAHDLGTFISVIFSRLFQRNNKSCGYLYYTCGLQKDLRYDIKNNSNLIQNKLLYDPNVINESIIIPPYATLIGEGQDNSIIQMQVGDDSALRAYVARTGDSLQQTGASIGTNGAIIPQYEIGRAHV